MILSDVMLVIGGAGTAAGLIAAWAIATGRWPATDLAAPPAVLYDQDADQ